jgi:hypothetical protein
VRARVPCSTIWDQGDFFWPGAAIAAATDSPHAAAQATQDAKAGAASTRRLREPQYGASEDTEVPQRQYKYENRQYNNRQYKDSPANNPDRLHPDDDSPVHRWPRHTYKEGEGDATDENTTPRGDHKRRRHQHQHPSYEEQPSAPYYPSEGPSYRNNRHENHSSGGYGSHGWPECWGTCLAGECKLDQSTPGCCQLSKGHGKGYASAAAVGGSSGDAQAAANSADGASSMSSGVSGVSYKEHGDINLVCWRDAEESGQRV